MAEKYWVGGAGTWDNSTTTNWSNSNGGAGGAAVPSATDNANFTTSSGNGTVTIAATAACANLVVNWTAVKTNIFSLSGNFSPAGNITINGNSTINRILIQSSVVGTQRTITNLGTVACTNVDFVDIKFNTAVDFSAQTNIGDANGNSGITFPASVAQTWSSMALQFDGSQNYVDLGTMGNFGGNLSNGFYCSFDIRTTSTALGYILGTINTGTATLIQIFANGDNAGSNVNHSLALQIRDNNGGAGNLQAACETPTINFNDGLKHTVVFGWVAGTQVITISIDGVSQSVTYNVSKATPTTFSNFGFSMTVAARNVRSAIGGYFACSLDNLKIGTASSTLYGYYLMDEGTGTTTADTSGNSNTGTLTKGAGAYPLWVGNSWSTNLWTTRVPLPQDDVSLNFAFPASTTVTADCPRLCRSLSFLGCTGSPIFANSVANTIYGSIDLTGIASVSGTNTLTLAGRG